jgi:hypothetical protein
LAEGRVHRIGSAKLKCAGHKNNNLADLHFGQPALDLALSWIDGRCLSFGYSHETGDGLQISDNKDWLIRED